MWWKREQCPFPRLVVHRYLILSYPLYCSSACQQYPAPKITSWDRIRRSNTVPFQCDILATCPRRSPPSVRSNGAGKAWAHWCVNIEEPPVWNSRFGRASVPVISCSFTNVVPWCWARYIFGNGIFVPAPLDILELGKRICIIQRILHICIAPRKLPRRLNFSPESTTTSNRSWE